MKAVWCFQEMQNMIFRRSKLQSLQVFMITPTGPKVLLVSQTNPNVKKGITDAKGNRVSRSSDQVPVNRPISPRQMQPPNSDRMKTFLNTLCFLWLTAYESILSQKYHFADFYVIFFSALKFDFLLYFIFKSFSF